ncbi:MBL fold metallo-hydrolase [Nocardioides pakistanensis]
MVRVEVVETTELGDRSYVAHDGEVAVVVDPQRDFDRIEEVLDRNGLRCALVVETHIHNDYVTGGLALAESTGATYALSAADAVSFDRRGLVDGEELEVGALRLQAKATPGHTETHLAFHVADDEGGPGAVFTGGSLLYGSVGRTDLVDPERTEELTRGQYRSVRRLAAMLSDDTRVYPTHGFGSFCSSGAATGGDGSTIGEERARNDALTEADEDVFVQRLIEGLTAYPSYYAQMGPLNRRGPRAPRLGSPEPVDPGELLRRVAAGEWVIDLRDRRSYARRHLAGTVGFPVEDQLSTYLGWLIPWGAKLTLVGESPEQVADAQRQLARIGIDDLTGGVVGVPWQAFAEQTRQYPMATFEDLSREMSRTAPVVLDVRRTEERAEGALRDSIGVPLHFLPDHLDELPAGQLWVHCASGLRSSIAGSLLDRAGHDVVVIDDDFARATELGLVDP